MSESKLKHKIENGLLYFVIFIVITVDTSFYTVNHVEGYLRVGIDLLAALIILIYAKTISVTKSDILVCSIIIIVLIVNGLVFSSIKQTVILSSFVIIAFLFKSSVKQDVLINKYCDILLLLALYSLFTYFVLLIAPSLILKLPVITRSNATGVYYNAFLSVISFNTHIKRNYGLFWEPGAFAIFLNIALFFEMYYKKQDFRRITILTITVLTTLSTTGIVCTIILYAAGLFKNSNRMNNNLKIFIIFIMCISSILIMREGDRFVEQVFGKLSGLHSGTYIQTTAVRIDAIKYPGYEFLKSPLWGIGFNRFLLIQDKYCMGMATCTYINWLCIYGVLGGLLPIIGVICFFSNKGENIVIKVLLGIFSVLLFSTENFVQILFIYLLFMYGISESRIVHRIANYSY